MSENRILEIDFCHRDDESNIVTYEWKLANTIGAAFWLKMLKQVCEQDVSVRCRFSGFVNGVQDWDYYGQRINKCISIINESALDYTIKERFNGIFSQDFSNEIHHHFEVLIGPDWNKAETFKIAEDEVALAICGLNEYIHEMESLHRSEHNSFEHRFHSAFVIFNWTKAIEIPDLCNEEFTLNYQWGDIVLNYAQIGKTWLEVYLDKDEDIFPEAILPLKQITGSFDIFFGELFHTDKILKEVKEFISARGGDPEDPTNRIGHLPVAHLLHDKDKKEELINDLATHQKFLGIRYIKDGLLKFEKRFDLAQEPISI